MNPAARLGGRHPLDAVHAALVLQLAVDAAPLDRRDHFFQAADAGIAARHRLEPPPVALGEHAVHPEELGGEQRRLVAAGAGADFEDDVLLVVRILGDQQNLELRQERLPPRDERLQLLFGELAHVRVAGGRQLFGLRDVADDGLVLAEPFDERLDLGQRLRVLPVLGRIALHLGRAEEAHQVLVALFFRCELVEHRNTFNRRDRKDRRDLFL